MHARTHARTHACLCYPARVRTVTEVRMPENEIVLSVRLEVNWLALTVNSSVSATNNKKDLTAMSWKHG
jgi:hypothetical protein